ncbi:MAG: argininosuccinate lyase [Armatimonadota bacterium]
MAKKSEKLWGGRFSADLADIALTFSESTAADGPMVAEDIWGSEAHAIMLAMSGIISEVDLREILKWLEQAREAWEDGSFKLKRELEDVHMNVETYLRQGAGPEFGGRLHTARSRNDQVVTDCKLHLRGRLLSIRERLAELQDTLLKRAEGRDEQVMPGYTHTQHAQPISIAFWLTSYVSMFNRDQERLLAAYKHTNTSPLGAAALAGTSFPTDRKLSAQLLGFDGVQDHALDCVGSRDFVAEAIAALAILMANLSKLAEEFVLWSSWEYRMLEIDDAYSSGSSIMPQKKNPCIAELTRGKVGIVYGRLMQILTMMKALPSGYNRDLQEDKPPLWEALDALELTLTAMKAMVETVNFNVERMRESVGKNFATATELANFLVSDRGLPFRTCHEIVGSLVGTLIAEGKTLDDHERVQEIVREHGQDLSLEEIVSVVDPVACLNRQVSLGSTGPKEVRRMQRMLTKAVGKQREITAEARAKLNAARQRTDGIVKKALAGKALGKLV